MAVVTFPDISDGERLLWEAFAHGTWVDLGGSAPAAGATADAGAIRAEVITALLLGAAEGKPGTVPGIRLRGARVLGALDLAGASTAWPLICENCTFDSEVRLAECSMKTVSITNSKLPGFDGTRLHLDGILNLRGSEVNGILRLEQAKVTGQLRLREAQVGVLPAGDAVSASGLAVDGDLDGARLHARGTVSLSSAVITGSVDLTDARIARPGGKGLNMNYAMVGGRLGCRGMIVDGETRMVNCRIAAIVSMRDVILSNPGGVALSAGGMTADGGVFLNGTFTARGELRLIGARLAANLTLDGARLENPDGLALNLDRASIGPFQGEGLTCLGQLSLVGTRVVGDLNMTRATAEVRDGRPAMSAERASVDGTLILLGMTALGEVNLRAVRVGERLVLAGSQLRSPAGTACRLSRAQVAADIFCDGMTAVGSLRLAGTSAGGAITLKQVQLDCPSGIALDAPALQARELVLLPATPIQGAVDLSYAMIGVLRDDPGSWPGQVRLEGLAYQALDPQLPASQRLQWLARDPRGHQPQPYEQLAAHYNAIGQPAQARAVLYAREQVQRRERAPVYRIWSLLQDVTVGYGYRPRRALAWLALLLGTGSVVFSIAPPPPLQPGAVPHFNGIIYTLDLLLPVVNLGQKYSFNPSGAEQWLSYLLIAVGWTLATTVAAGAARILRRS